jgi:ElaB/YqjD/DUF883 family membrane-anchored ribosome-binding protein
MAIESDRTTDKAAEAAHEAVERMAARVDQIEDHLRQTAADARMSIRETAGKAQRASHDVVTDVRQYVFEHPVATLGIAFAAGVVFSALLRR